MKQSGKRWWLIAGIILIVSVVLAIVFITAAKPAHSLQPGGLIKGVDGVAVAAPQGALDHKINIYIERVEDPSTEVPLPGFLEDVKLIGPFYEITASEEYMSEETGDLLLGLPLPEGVSPDNLAVVGLAPPWALITGEDDPSLRWDILFGAYDPNSSLFGILLPYVGGSPQVFALVEWEDYSTAEDSHQNSAALNDLNYGDVDLGLWNDGKLLALAAPQPLTSTVVQGYPISEVAQLSGSESNSIPPVFVVRCVGFDQGECKPAHKIATAAALLEAYNAYISLDFKKPRLRNELVSVNFEDSQVEVKHYEYQLRKGHPTGRYNCVFKTAYTQYPGHPEEPRDHTTHHELFHAVQYAYPQVLKNAILNISCNYGVIEGTARLADASLNLPLERSDRSDVLIINNRLFNDALEYGNFVPTDHSYSHQDFWVYVGKRMNPVDAKLNFLIPLFEKGDSLSAVNEWLEEEGTFQSLNDALWQWTKNQAFEKKVKLDAKIPHGSPGEWSGHGTISHKISLSTTSESYEGGSGDTSVISQSYFMRYREPKVFEITLKPGEAHYMAKVYPKINYHGEYHQISPNYPELLYKFYPVPARSLSFTWNETRENKAHTFRVYDEDVKIYVLVFPQSPGHSFDIKFIADISTLPPSQTLTVRSSGASQASVTAVYVKDEDGSYQTYSGLTNYTLSDIRPNTTVVLKATPPDTIPAVEFSHWSGAVESTNPLVWLTMNQDTTMTAHFKRVEQEVILPPGQTPGPGELSFNLSVSSQGASSVPVTSTTGHGGTTSYMQTGLAVGAQVNLQAPEYVGSGSERKRFSHWSGAVSTTNRATTFFMNGNKTVTANYVNDPEEVTRYKLSVLSQGVSEVAISSTTGHGGTTNYELQLLHGTSVTLIAPEYVGSGKGRQGFSHWSGAVSSKNRTVNLMLGTNTTLTAHYVAAPEETFYLSVLSNGASNVEIFSTTGHGGNTGNIGYSIPDVKKGTEVQLTAPKTSGKARFSHWSGAVESNEQTITFKMDTNKVVTANYGFSLAWHWHWEPFDETIRAW